MSGNEEVDSLRDSCDETDSLNVTVESNDGYCTFQLLKERSECRNYSIKSLLHGLKQLGKFIKQVNQIHCCATPGCKGVLSPIDVRSVGLGGTLSSSYACNSCASQWSLFETSSKYKLSDATKINVAAQVAFIIAGCTHVTYYKVLKHALGIEELVGQPFTRPLRECTLLKKWSTKCAMMQRTTSDAWTKINLMVHGVMLSHLLMSRGHHATSAFKTTTMELFTISNSVRKAQIN